MSKKREITSKKFLNLGNVSEFIQNLCIFLRSTIISQTPYKCCGIVGYIGKNNAESILIQGIKILQNRGYDSCGICTISKDQELITTKFASRGTTSDCIALLEAEAPKKHSNHSIGIGHTRWATHGAKNDKNSHPHHDFKDSIAIVHNGTIDNYKVLKDRLKSEQIPFRTETDSEVIANLISWYLDKTSDLERAIKAACSELQGTWGLAILHKDCSDQLFLARNGSPLLVSVTDEEVFVASEISALAPHTNQYFSLRDGETYVLKVGEMHGFTNELIANTIHLENIETSPSPFSHWTLKEIYEQPASIQRAINHGARIPSTTDEVKLGGLDAVKASLLKIRNLVLTGCGTSFYAALYGEKLMRSLRCFESVVTCDASELTEDNLPPEMGGILLMSQSGETLDVIRAFQLAEHFDIQKFSVVNAVGSHLARLTDCGVYINAGREVAVASTKAFTSQVAILALICLWFAQNDGKNAAKRLQIMNSVRRLSESIFITLKQHELIRKIASKISDAQSIFVLGKGFGHCAALEGALKIKELAYIHAEGLPAGSLKHGPFALLDAAKRTPVILVILSDESVALLKNVAEQVKARGAYLIGIADVSTGGSFDDTVDEMVKVPSLGYMTALLATVVLQLLAYELALARGINPDKPRGLAKTVTVS